MVDKLIFHARVGSHEGMRTFKGGGECSPVLYFPLIFFKLKGVNKCLMILNALCRMFHFPMACILFSFEYVRFGCFLNVTFEPEG